MDLKSDPMNPSVGKQALGIYDNIAPRIGLTWDFTQLTNRPGRESCSSTTAASIPPSRPTWWIVSLPVKVCSRHGLRPVRRPDGRSGTA